MLTPNEIRRAMNLPPLPGGDALYIPNLAGDKEAAHTAWHARFHNRKPPAPGEVREARVVKVQAGLQADTTEILLYDEIGYWGVTAKEFVAALAEIGSPKIVVRINSPGGDVFDGLAIYGALANLKSTTKQSVTTQIDGLAASAASFIALAGDTVSIMESAMMMVHRAWGLAIGNEADMTDMATTLRQIDGQLAGIYAKQTGKPVEEMSALMAGTSDGTWFTAQEAADLGLVDEVIDPDAERDPEAEASAKTMAALQAMRRRLALADHD
ncbi:MAG TPA: head maturation protease, ClpP-related [Reyranella sp.]|nr:head maturation protease, ClpP-related [Reyranella sp.]HTE81991.1 head maturation protease, ClpP-related [Reyranella sp.]